MTTPVDMDSLLRMWGQRAHTCNGTMRLLHGGKTRCGRLVRQGEKYCGYCLGDDKDSPATQRRGREMKGQA